MCIPQSGQNCTIIFLQPLTLYTVMSLKKKRPVSFPAYIPFAACIFQEAFYDPYTAQHKYAIQVPLAGKTWTVHVKQGQIAFVSIT